jgi:hypothetical protein
MPALLKMMPGGNDIKKAVTIEIERRQSHERIPLTYKEL